MEQYKIDSPSSLSFTEGKYFDLIHKKHVDSYTLKGANNIVPVRVKLDDSKNTPGWKFNEYEMKGVPLRLEIGPRDIENGVATFVRRDTREKAQLSLETIATGIPAILEQVQQNMF